LQIDRGDIIHNIKKMNILSNLVFWSAVCGFTGTILLYFFGLPPEVHSDGHINLVLEQVDESQIRLAAVYDWYSRLAIGLIALSFHLAGMLEYTHSALQGLAVKSSSPRRTAKDLLVLELSL